MLTLTDEKWLLTAYLSVLTVKKIQFLHGLLSETYLMDRVKDSKGHADRCQKRHLITHEHPLRNMKFILHFHEQWKSKLHQLAWAACRTLTGHPSAWTSFPLQVSVTQLTKSWAFTPTRAPHVHKLLRPSPACPHFFIQQEPNLSTVFQVWPDKHQV